MFSLESTGATIFQYHKTRKSFKHDGSKSYQDFYFELRATRYETLLKNLTYIKDKEVAKAFKAQIKAGVDILQYAPISIVEFNKRNL